MPTGTRPQVGRLRLPVALRAGNFYTSHDKHYFAWKIKMKAEKKKPDTGGKNIGKSMGL
jgi:hypothetical protein